MKQSDFKHIVKESLREAFYTKKVILEGIGKKVSITTWIGNDEPVTYPAVLSKNTIPYEKPYRISWFSLVDRWQSTYAEGHVDMNEYQFNKLMNGEQDSNVAMKISEFMESDRIHLNLTDDELKLDEGINGHKMTVNYYGDTLPAILSKNSKPGEKPYRISVFSGTDAKGHVELTQQEAEEILQNHKLPDDVIRKYGVDLTILTIDEGTLQEPLKEELYGKKLKINYFGKEVNGVLSKNMRPDDTYPISQFPYRISWFDNSNPADPEPKGHIELTQEEVDYILENQQFPFSVYDRIKLSTNSFMMVNPSIHESKIQLNEELTGQRVYIVVDNQINKQLGGPLKVQSVISKNTKEKDWPYRITWFNRDRTVARGHVSLKEDGYQYILKNKDLTIEAKVSLSEPFDCEPEDISLEFVDKFDESLDETLLLLENTAREIDLWLENKSVIVESMHMIVSGANYNRTDRLDELVNHLQDTVVSPILRKMTDPAQIDYFHKNSVGFWNMLSADGSYYEMQSGNPALGIINFYPAGIPADMARRIILGILKQLKILGVQWGQLKKEKSRAYKISDVIRIPITVNNSKEYEGPSELNLANANAYQIFNNILQYEGENEFEMDAKDLMERIETIMRHDRSWIEKNQIKPTNSDWPAAERDTPQDIENPHLDIVNKIGGKLGDGSGGAGIIGVGLDTERIEYIMLRIYNVAKWAVEHGHSKIYVS